jgi:hypothetical protein
MPADEVANMIRANDYFAFRGAAQRGHLAVMERLMLFPDVFCYADQYNNQGYAVIATNFVDQFLLRLRGRIDIFTIENPAGVFDMTDAEEARLCFYLMRHLIRRNTTASFEELTFLLTIPAVQALAHQAVTLGARPNELLSFARQCHHREAVEYLLTIPAVNALEQAQQQSLGAQFGHQEASMAALTEDEHKRLGNAEKKYLPEIAGLGGAAAVIDLIKQDAIKRYAAAPATLNLADGHVIALPLSFDDFVGLELEVDSHALALKSYYQHPLHTAYRYLSKPNRWMHPDAPHVHRGAAGAYAMHEGYEELIALMYLAVCDKDIPKIYDMNTEARLDFFFKELAWLGRAHNWDNRRINEVTHQQEHYDDLGADKPSCSLGIKKRLMCATFLVGHPLFQMLNQKDIDVEVIKIVREHFMSRITNENVAALIKEWDKIIAGEGFSTPSPLDELNFTADEQAQHTASIINMFEHLLDDTLRNYIRLRLEVASPFHNLAAKFGGEVELAAMLEQKQAALQQPHVGMFAPAAAESTSAVEEQEARFGYLLS